MATKKRSSFRSRGAAIGRSLARGLKGTAVAGGTGVGAFFVHDQVNKNVQFMASKPWITPLAMIALGHVVKQRSSLVVPGIALTGAGGYALGNALSFMMSTNRAENAAKAGQAAEAKGLEDQETAALLEAGMPGVGDYNNVGQYEDVGALISAADNLTT
jgi:hypothetical protein